MELLELTKTIRDYFPEKAVEISETLGLLRENLDDTRSDIKILMMELFDQGKHEAIAPHNRLGANILEYMARIQEIQSALEPDEQIQNARIEEENKDLPDYSEYIVDCDVVHNLQEDFTFKRPAGFQLEGQRIEVKTWQQMLSKTCELLFDKDPARFKRFEHDPAMKGRKQKLVSSNPADMRNPIKIEKSDLYVETNLSANSIRNLITRMLGRYGIKHSEYKIYLRADYTGRHE